MMGDSSILLALFGLSATKFSILLSLYKKRPRSAELVGHVSGITLYPIKSCRGIQLSEAECTFMGLRTTGKDPRPRDRYFMIIQENGVFISQRTEPSLALIVPSVGSDNMLHVEAPNMRTLRLPLHTEVTSQSKIIECSVQQGDKLQGLDCGDEAARWVSNFLNKPARIVYAATNIQRRNIQQYSPFFYHPLESRDEILFSDIAPNMLIGEASLADLNTRLEKQLTMKSFRPTIVVSTSKPYDEDSWDQIYIGQSESGIKLRNLRGCPRCILTTVDPATGTKNPDEQPLKTLKSYREDKQLKGKPLFGILLYTDHRGQVKIGDPVFATKREEDPQTYLKVPLSK